MSVAEVSAHTHKGPIVHKGQFIHLAKAQCYVTSTDVTK